MQAYPANLVQKKILVFENLIHRIPLVAEVFQLFIEFLLFSQGDLVRALVKNDDGFVNVAGRSGQVLRVPRNRVGRDFLCLIIHSYCVSKINTPALQREVSKFLFLVLAFLKQLFPLLFEVLVARPGVVLVNTGITAQRFLRPLIEDIHLPAVHGLIVFTHEIEIIVDKGQI